MGDRTDPTERDAVVRELRDLAATGDRRGVERLLIDRGEALVAQGEAAAVVAAGAGVDPRSADPRLLTVLGRARQVQGDWLGALACLQVAAGTGPLDPAVALRLGQLYYLTGRTDRAVEVFERARGGPAGERAGDLAGDLAGIRLICEAAIWLRAAGEDERAATLAARGAEAAERCGDRATLAQCHRVLALLAAHAGDRAANDLHHQRALRLAVDLDDALLRLGLLINRASYLVEEGSPAEALETAEAALALAAQPGMRGYEPLCHSIRGRAYARVGRFAEAGAEVDAAQRRWREIGPSLDIAFGLLVRGDVHRRRGEPSQAQAVLEEALHATPDGAGMKPLRALILPSLARVRAGEDVAAARVLAEQAVELATGTGRVPALLARGWVALLSGDRAAAATDAGRARTLAGTRRDRGGLAEALELTVLSGPKPEDAARLLDEAGALWRDLGDPIGAARVRLIAARLAGPAGRPAAEAAEANLRRRGVRLGSGVADALAVPIAQPRIMVQTLGAFRVLRGGAPIPPGDWKSRKARDLFKILVSHRGQPLSRERLMDLLWPDEPTQRTANRLSVLLSTLRTVLDPDRAMPEPGPILADRDAVGLDGARIASDLETFLSTAAAAQAADRRGDPEAAGLLEAAEAAYTGEFLPEATYTEWSQPVRDVVRTTHIALLRALTRHAASPEQRERYLLELLRHDPYDEQSHRQLIHVLRAAGRHGEARRRYEDYLKRMAEIGLTPAPLVARPS
jgi:DNA-binding SARP family transcriptional activator